MEQWRAREVARLLALVEAERRYYQEIIAVMPVGLALFDSELSFVSANRSFREIFGLSSSALAKTRLRDLFPGGEVEYRIDEVLESGEAQRNITVEYVTPEGPRALRLSIQPFRGWGEEADNEVLLVVEDLEAKPSEAALKVNGHAGSLLENIDAIVWERDPETLRYLYVAGRGADILGYPPEEWTAAGDFDQKRVHPEDRDWVRAFYKATISCTDSRSCEYRALTADGRTLWLRDVIRVIRDENGTPVKLSGITVNVDAEKLHDEQVIQAEKIAALGRLAGKVTHDCNNLLMIVSGYSEELLDKLPADNTARSDVEEIIAAADRLSNLTTELLQFTRRPSLRPKLFSLNSLIGSFEPGIRRELGPAVRLELLLNPELGFVNADWDQLGDAILTLVRESCDAMPGGGQLRVTTANTELAGGNPRADEGLPPGRYVTLSITNSGEPMDEETRGRLFEPFFASQRTGQDLPSVYTLIRNSGGDIRVTSGPDGGNCFTIYLPYVARPAAAPVRAPEAPVEEPAKPAARETILIAEDEPGIRALVRKILQKQGYSVLEAGSGEEALSIAASHGGEIHLLLTDVIMHGLSGRELHEQLRRQRPETKVLFVSGYTGDELATEGALPEGAAFLQKPFSLSALLAQVRTILQS